MPSPLLQDNWDHLKLDNFTSLQGVFNGSATPPLPTLNSRQKLFNITNLGGVLNDSPTSVVGNSVGFHTPPLSTFNSRQPLSNITNLGGVFNGSPTHGFCTPPLPTLNSRQPLCNITNLGVQATTRSTTKSSNTPQATPNDSTDNRKGKRVSKATTHSTTASTNTPQATPNVSTVPCSAIFKNLFAATNSPRTSGSGRCPAPPSAANKSAGGLNVTPGSFAADTDGFDTPPLPMYNSRQPLSNVTNLSVPCSDIFKNLFAQTNSPHSCTTQNEKNRSLDTTQVPCSRLFHPTVDDTNYEDIENSHLTDIPSEDEEPLPDDYGSDVTEDSSEPDQNEDAHIRHQGNLFFSTLQ
ncbi:hypothetical protein DCAR_0414434 [Daucus carota subsp. sativus]|uniref:Uncharacterized protein n=1 Tax=Daucus carota subsp. sativus TaxID=79200 RepID=A0AAF1AVX7_DAUCS|nr:hypothetical protein DCAR_0414434 [Daucus carota subsp. sativus]